MDALTLFDEALYGNTDETNDCWDLFLAN